MDRDGTRGVAVLQAQMTDLAKDLAELKGESRTWQNAHEQQHLSSDRERVAGRRWLVTTAVAGLASMAAVIGLLIDLVAHTPH